VVAIEPVPQKALGPAPAPGDRRPCVAAQNVRTAWHCGNRSGI